jgi:hypothetical protein
LLSYNLIIISHYYFRQDLKQLTMLMIIMLRYKYMKNDIFFTFKIIISFEYNHNYIYIYIWYIFFKIWLGFKTIKRQMGRPSCLALFVWWITDPVTSKLLDHICRDHSFSVPNLYKCSCPQAYPRGSSSIDQTLSSSTDYCNWFVTHFHPVGHAYIIPKMHKF